MPQSDLSKALHSRPFQMEGARFAMEHRNVLIADEPGLGKTIQSIAAVIGSKTSGSILVVAPKTAIYVTWPAELRRWLTDVAPKDRVVAIGGKQSRKDRLALVQDVIDWEAVMNPELGSFAHKDDPPVRQWVLISPNYVRFDIKCDSAGNFDYDENGEKVILPVREALLPLVYMPWATIIVDEGHQTLAGATGNVKTQSAQSRGLRLLEVRENGLKLVLSGTPFRGKHANLWGILNFLEPQQYPDGNHGGKGTLPYWRWIRTHFDVYVDDQFGSEIIGSLKSEKALATEARRVMIRRTKSQVVPELPDKMPGGSPLYPDKHPPERLTNVLAEALAEQRDNPKIQVFRLVAQKAQGLLNKWHDKNNPIAVWLPMEGPQRTAYQQMKKEAMAQIEGGTLLANSILTERLRLKQFANSLGRLDENDNFHPDLPSNKFDWLLQFLAERGIDGPEPSGNRVVVGSQFTRHIYLFAKALREQYKIPCFTLTGKTSEEDRVTFQEKFQDGTGPEVFLLNTKAGGVSLTLDAADDVVVLDRTENPDDQVQLEDRCHRISRIHNVTVWNLCSKGTIDTRIHKDGLLTGGSLRRILDSGGTRAAMELLEG